MRYYNSKNVEREYVVVKHQLRGIDTELMGVRYREGYGVVAKHTKEYYNLKQVKMAVVAEYPIAYLKNLKCVTSPSQIKTIWGADIYKAYSSAVKKAAVEQPQLTPNAPIEPTVNVQCEGQTAAGSQCKNDSIDGTIFCKKHVHFDTRLAAILIDAGEISKPERQGLVEQWVANLRKD